MNQKSFADTFSKMNLQGSLFEQFRSTRVANLCLSRTNMRLQFDLLCEKMVNRDSVAALKEALTQKIGGIKSIDIQLKYTFGQDMPLKELFASYLPEILAQLEQVSQISTWALQTAEFHVHDNVIEIAVRDKCAALLKRKAIDKMIAAQLESCFGRNVVVRLCDSIEPDAAPRPQSQAEAEFIKSFAQSQPIAAKQIEKKQAGLQKTVPFKKGTRSASSPFGKTITGTRTPISGCREEGEVVIVEGEVVRVDARELRSGDKYIIIFDLTDFSDAITLKFFIKKELYEEGEKDKLKVGMRLRAKGEIQNDRFSGELNIMVKDIMPLAPLPELMDYAEEKRVELHLHTQMSSMDATNPIGDYVKRAAKWGHKAIAITDHAGVQAYPDAIAAGKKHNIKILFGVEGYLIDDLSSVVQCPRERRLSDTFVVFDIETTGLTKEVDKIIEIGAVKIENGEMTERFSAFINPHMPLSAETTKLTGITDEMVADALDYREVVPAFISFCGDAVIVAHNAGFDVGFIRHAVAKLGMGADTFTNPTLCTVELSRLLFPELNRHKLDIVAKHLQISLENHHRAVDDAEATAQIFLHCMGLLRDKNIDYLKDINLLASEAMDYKKMKTYHIILFAKTQVGVQHLYELISKSHIQTFFKRPRMRKSEIIRLREGLMIGSACEAGELYSAILNDKPEDYIESIISFYDYLEIQPLANNSFLIDKQRVEDMEGLKNMNRRIVAYGEAYNKPVVATCDAHFLDRSDDIYRKIILAAEGFSDVDKQAPLYFRTTDEMLEEFSYLGPQKAREVVITNTNFIADSIEAVKPIQSDPFPPAIEGAEEQLRTMVEEKAASIYGTPFPAVVAARLTKELHSIIKNGFSVMYIIAQKLVWKSLEDGYLVGSRGSVGSSFVATMSGITEVNPLPPHYVCKKCRYSDFDSEIVKAFVGASGCDMPDQACPVCGEPLYKDGHDIPFETFLGFDGDKEPDIDLNFSGDYQQVAHAYTAELFGEKNVFKVGTIGTLAEKTAYGFVKKYLDERNKKLHRAEIDRLVKGCTGIKRTTGQHPGGLIVLPQGHSIYEFTPVQRPANDMQSNVITTHFDYHSALEGRLLKLDILGHDDPTVIRMLEDITQFDAKSISLSDSKTMSLFQSPQALQVQPSQINNCETGTLGIPEFGTKFVRQMLMDTKPTTFAELVRISGLSHGTSVWLDNAQELVRNKVATLKEAICTRDDIMTFLIYKGVDHLKSFKIMEKVRKGKGLAPEDEEAMREKDVPQWYIDSCNKIQYMFPKAHAAAYVMMAFRIAYFKVNYPEAFYAAYFTVRADDFDYETMCRGECLVKRRIEELEALGNDMTAKEKSLLTVLELALEMYARGLSFLPLDLYESDAKNFIVKGRQLLPPLNSVEGLGVTAAESIVEARKKGEFLCIEDLKNRTGVTKTVIELLKENKILKGMPETSQLSLFV